MHRCARTGDNIGHVVILNRIGDSPLICCLRISLGQRAEIDEPFFAESRYRGDHGILQIGKTVEAKIDAKCIGQGAQDRPVLARVARCKYCFFRILHAAFGVYIGAVFLREGRGRQNDICRMGALITMMADIDLQAIIELGKVDLVRT